MRGLLFSFSEGAFGHPIIYTLRTINSRDWVLSEARGGEGEAVRQIIWRSPPKV